VDAAAELIRLARQRSAPAIQYHVGDARDLSFLPAEAFAAVTCILAIQNIHPILPVFQSAQRVLVPGGRLVMVMMHPCFRGPKETSWGWDEARRVQYRRVDRYLIPRKAPIVTNPGSAPDKYTWSFHKPIEAYVKALRHAGLLIDALEEWTSHKTTAAGPRAPAENASRKEIPLFMAVRAVKVATGPATEPLPPELGE
jgi:SAM-dependent methyltransferase